MVSNDQDVSSSTTSKRKRSPTADDGSRTKQSGLSGTHSNQASPAYHSRVQPSQPPSTPQAQSTIQDPSVDYLSRAHPTDLPLLSPQDSISSILQLLGAYHGILDRNESLASNLGAKPASSEAMRRFESMFHTPPKVILTDNTKVNGTKKPEPPPNVSWHEVALFTQAHPEQLNLSTIQTDDPAVFRRVCQFALRDGVQVQISESDYHLLKSDLHSRILPPDALLPHAEDEQKELGTLDILERAVSQITGMADQVAASARRANRRLQGRRGVILQARVEQGVPSDAKVPSTIIDDLCHTFDTVRQLQHPELAASNNYTHTPSSNSRPRKAPRASTSASTVAAAAAAAAASATATDVSNNVFAEPNAPFLPPQYAHQPDLHSQPQSHSTPTQHHLYHAPSTATPFSTPTNTIPPPRRRKPTTSTSSTANPANTPFPSPLHSTDPPHIQALQAHIATLPRGAQILPPCDRCRRLRIQCVRNLSACAGCTRKHARCSWRIVRPEEMGMPVVDGGDAPVDGDGVGDGAVGGDAMAEERVDAKDGAETERPGVQAQAQAQEQEQEQERDAVKQLARIAEALSGVDASSSSNPSSTNHAGTNTTIAHTSTSTTTTGNPAREAPVAAPVANMAGAGS